LTGTIKEYMLKLCITRKPVLIISLICCTYVTARAQQNAGKGDLKYVDPLIGNVGLLLEPTRPTVQLPNQVMRMYPIRKDYLDDQISSFPLLVVSHRLGEAFAIKPSTKKATVAGFSRKMAYDHDLEITRPWYYATYLVDDDITIEYAPGKKAGIYRFSFPQGAEKSILFDIYNKANAEWKFISANEITGVETYHGDIKIYMYGIFSEAGAVGTVKNNRLSSDAASAGNTAKAWIDFSSSKSKSIEFKYAISFISPAQAKKNFDNELQATTFEQLKQAGEDAWDKKIGQIKVTGGTEAQKRSFYTALYRCYERPVDITEDGKYYSGYDKKVHDAKRPFYVDDWTWDTYLAHHPLKVILDPAYGE
jgi:predicted alpha-1,2-mannosidase